MFYKMIHKNREGLEEFNIAEDWYKNRKPGISAMLRVHNEEEWIGPCLESTLPFFDEIVITIDSTDRTKDIINRFIHKEIKGYEKHAHKIKMFDYPFYLGEVNGKSYPDSVHDRAYYSNWTLSKTSFETVCKWDADMIMLPKLHSFYSKILTKNVVRVGGYNVASINPFVLSKEKPFDDNEPIFFRIHKNIFFLQASEKERQGKNWFLGTDAPLARLEVTSFDRAGLPKIFDNRLNEWLHTSPRLHVKRLTDILIKKDVDLKEPLYIHTKYIKKNLADVWFPPNVKNFQEHGEKKNIDLPDYAFRTVEDYL